MLSSSINPQQQAPYYNSNSMDHSGMLKISLSFIFWVSWLWGLNDFKLHKYNLRAFLLNMRVAESHATEISFTARFSISTVMTRMQHHCWQKRYLPFPIWERRSMVRSLWDSAPWKIDFPIWASHSHSSRVLHSEALARLWIFSLYTHKPKKPPIWWLWLLFRKLLTQPSATSACLRRVAFKATSNSFN